MATYYVAPYGSNTNNGTSPSTPWQLLSFALGAASGTNPGLTAGDTLWISPGTYRDASGFTYNGNPGTSGNPVNIYGDPTFTRAWSAGTAGPVRITTASSDTSIAPVATSALTLNKEYITVQDLCLDSSPPNSLGFVLSGVLAIGSSAGNITVTRCVIQTEQANSASRFFSIGCNIGNGKTNFTFDKCVFLLGGAIYSGINTQSSTPHNVNVVIKDCTHVGTEGYTFFGQTTNQANGISIYNCTNIGSANCVYLEALATNSGTTIRNCNFLALRNAVCITSTATTLVTEDYNRLSGTTVRTNVSTGANSVNVGVILDKESGLLQGYGTYPFFAALQGFGSIGAGVVSGAPTVDIFNNSWLGNPSIGSVESKARGTGTYSPTERNASTITIAPGSTSQSIELYLGVVGLTASTSGLSARYNRTRTASVSIPLVARTIAQAWTSGGFAEVDATNMPGVYRLDLPDAALAAGADDVTVVVRGASGTNGAVMTVKLSSGGLTSAQTASAVWGASPAGYNDATTFGGVVNQIDQTVTGIDTTVQDIPSNVWDELKANHTIPNTFGDYLDTKVSTGADTSRIQLRQGPFLIKQNAVDSVITEVNQFLSTTPNIEMVLIDSSGGSVSVAGSTLVMRVRNQAGTAVINNITPTVAYADGGVIRWSPNQSWNALGVTTAGTYRIVVERTMSGVTTTFGPFLVQLSSG